MFLGIHALGFFCAGFAILRSRTPQGATAWIMALLTIPALSVPLYVIFGRSRFEGYNTKRKLFDARVHKRFEALKTMEDMLSESEEIKIINSTISSRNQPGFTHKNSIRLLVDGEKTYQVMLEELEKAQNYIVFQFFIFRYDRIGKKFIDMLIRKAHEGVRITFLYDEIGEKLPGRLIKKLRHAGIKVGAFNKAHGRGHWQINFRNHRKIIVIDGKIGFLGGLNIGDDYLGKWKKIGAWRDTHIMLEGPSVIAAQLASAKDWYCSQEEVMDVDWKIYPATADANILILHTGPADDRHTCLLAHMTLINAASHRLWIANPYFVPPESLMDAILLAALRGVDVRILLPYYSDNKSVLLAMRVYERRLIENGVKIYKYTEGFLHQKVMLVDHSFACVGSANFDFRSMFINFEVSGITTDKKFIADVEEMLIRDFQKSKEMQLSVYEEEGLLKTIASRGANLMAPIL